MMLYSTELLRKEFSRLSFEVLEERTLPLDEGTFHSGEAEVVRAVAVKR